MNWLINQLFGSQASSHLGDKIKALVAQYLLTNPGITEAAVQAWVESQADHIILQILVFFPSWATGILTAALNSEIGKLTSQAFQQLAPRATASAGS